MSADPQAVVYLDSARPERTEETPERQIAQLRSELATERSAGKAMLVTVLELERRADTERRTGQALLATVRGLEGVAAAERRNLREQRLVNERLWGDINGLDIALREAERPLWRKLLRRH